MKDSVRRFIEKHISLIENNDLVLLFQILYSDESMYEQDAIDFCDVLYTAKIDYEDQRREAVNNILINDIAAFSRGIDPGVTSLPLDLYAEFFIDNHLGLSVEYWVDEIIEHKKDYLTVDIFQENGKWIISRKGQRR